MRNIPNGVVGWGILHSSSLITLRKEEVMRFCNVVWTAMVVGLLGGALLLSGCGQKVAAPLPFTVTTRTGTTPTTRVSLYGRVLDQDGIPVQGASVTLGTKRVTSGAGGSYVFTGLLPGTYVVSVSLQGYIAGGAAFLVSTADVIGADLTVMKLEDIPNAEDVRGTEIVEVTEEGVTVGVKAITSGVPVGELTVEEKKTLFSATLVLQSGVQIKDATGNVVTEAPELSMTYLEQSQLPAPATGTFGMSAANVVTRPGTREVRTQEVVIEGETVELAVETPNELLREGTVVRASSVPFAGFVMESNGEQGWTFDGPQVLTVNPANLSVPVDLIGAGLPPGTQIPFVDSEGQVTYATLQDDGTLDLEVSKIDTYLMQVDFNIDVIESEVTALAGAAKPVAPQVAVTSDFDMTFDPPQDPAYVNFLMGVLVQNLGLSEAITDVVLELAQSIVTMQTTITVTMDMVLGGTTFFSVEVTIVVTEDGITEVGVEVITHESGKLVGG